MTENQFVEWFFSNYNKHTIIVDPVWHARKIFAVLQQPPKHVDILRAREAMLMVKSMPDARRLEMKHFEALEQVIHKCDMYQQPQYRCVGQASALPGTGNAFTCGAFQAEDVPVGYSLYVKV
jgi:hypothetical protein